MVSLNYRTSIAPGWDVPGEHVHLFRIQGFYSQKY